MQGAVFAKVLQMSLTGCYSIGIVLAVRLLLLRLLRCGRVHAYYLWVLMFLGLCLPVSIPGRYSLIPRQVAEFSLTDVMEEREALPPVTVYQLSLEEISPGSFEGTSGEADAAERISVSDQEHSPGEIGEAEAASAQGMTGPDWTVYLAEAEKIWLLGVLFLGLYHLFAVFRMSARCSGYGRADRKKGERIVEAADVPSPFLWGFFRPVIYLPAGLDGEERAYILAHETVHRNRKDHLVKLFLLAVTILHWFNPLVWAAYVLCGRDMEISCDEAVLKNSRTNIQKAYAESLLKYAAAQNRFLIRPLGFGEPSLKSRIKHVLHFRKKNIWISMAAGLCVIGVVAGLWHHPSGGTLPPQTPDSQPEPLSEGEAPQVDESEGLVVNNGGEIICVAGAYYYMDGVPLYSDGEALYTSVFDDGTWHVCRYEMDGSGSRRLFDGWIVDSTEYGQVLYCMLPGENGEGKCLGWYDTRTRKTGRFSREGVSWLGKYEGYLYTSWQAADGLHVDRIRETDRTEEADLLKEGIPGDEMVKFYADEGRKRLVFAVRSSGEDTEGVLMRCYSCEPESGEIVSKELTGLSDFAMMDGYLYFQRYKSREDHTPQLYRTDYEFQSEEQIGEGWTLLCAEEETNTLLVRKSVEHPDYSHVSSLVRVWPDQKEEQMLLDMEQMLLAAQSGEDTGSADLGLILDWEFQREDDVRYSQLNRFEERLYVTVSHLRDQEETPLEEVHLTVDDQGAVGIWFPDELSPGSGDMAGYTESMVGQPVGMEAEGWDLEHVLDVREYFQELPAKPDASERSRTYLLGETEYWTLYGKGDYESMLLVRNGRYTEIRYPYRSGDPMLPELMEAHLDEDHITELAIRLRSGHGTGMSADALLVADFQNNGSWVYEFQEGDYMGPLMTYLASEQADPKVESAKASVRFSFDKAEGTIQIQAESDGEAVTADVVWTGDQFTLKHVR